MQPPATVKVALVDDHKLFRKGMVELINGFSGYTVCREANNGREFTEKLSPGDLPDIVLLDINMPEMNGYDTALWLKKRYPSVKVLALSMYDDEEAIIKMLKSGAKGYVLKDTDPAELKTAFSELMKKGFYYSDLVSGTLISNITDDKTDDKPTTAPHLNDREIEFLKLSCTELTYREIADQMALSTRTVDGYRETLFDKLNVKSRVGLVLFAIKHGIVSVS